MANDIPVVNTFQFAGAFVVPSTVSFRVVWEASARPRERGSGDAVPPTNPAAFLGRFAAADARGSLSGEQLGFRFASETASSSEGGYAQFGDEQNGVFL